MSFSVAVCTKNRDRYLNRTVRSILNQSILPSKIYIIKTVQKVSQQFRKKIFIRGYSKVEIITLEFANTEAQTIGFSRNVALNACKSDQLFFVDDDVVLEKNTFKKLLKISQADNRLFSVSGKVVGIDNSLFSRYMTWFHSQGLLNAHQPQLIENASTTCVLIDLKKWRDNRIWFPTQIDAGEDVLFFAYYREQGYLLLYYPKVIINHDFFLQPFDFFHRFFWYSTSMIQTNRLDKNFFYEYHDYLPYRKLNRLFFPLFVILRAYVLTVKAYEKKKIIDKSLFWPEFLKNATYVVGITYSKYKKLFHRLK